MSRIKNIIITLITSLLCLTTFNAGTVYAEGESATIKRGTIWKNVFDLTPLSSLYAADLSIVFSNGVTETVFCVEPDKQTVDYSTYTSSNNVSGLDGAINVYFNYLENYIGTINKTNAEKFAVQIAIWSKIKNYDPANLTITAASGTDLYNTAVKIKNMAHSLFVSSYVFNDSPNVFVGRYIGGTIEKTQVPDYNFNYSTSKVINKSGSYYWATDYVLATTEQKHLVSGADYTITLANAPSGTIITNSIGQKIGTTSAHFSATSEHKAFRVLVPYNQEENSGTITVNVNGYIERMAGLAWVSSNSQKLLGRRKVTNNFSTNFKINYESKTTPSAATHYIDDIKINKVAKQITRTVGTSIKSLVWEEKPLENATFEIQYGKTYTPKDGISLDVTEGTAAATNADSDINGVATFSDVEVRFALTDTGEIFLPTGGILQTLFKIKEVSAPDGFVKDSNTYDLYYVVANCSDTNKTMFPTACAGKTSADAIKTLATYNGSVFVEQTDSIKLTNTPEYAEFSFKKVDEKGNALAGAKFKIQNAEKITGYNSFSVPVDTVLGELTSGIDGTVSTNELGDYKLPYGYKYTITETSAPTGYSVDRTKYLVDIGLDGKYHVYDSSGQVISNFTNYSSTTVGVELIKKDSLNSSKAVSGATYKMYADSTTSGAACSMVGSELDSGVTDTNGRIKFTHRLNLYDKVCIKETSAPTGYSLDKNYYSIIINSTATSTYTLNVTDDPISTATASLKVKKVDESDLTKVLQGAVFELYNASNTKIGSGTTDSNGLVYFKDLTVGTYTLKETKAPSGYTLSGQSIKVEIKETDKSTVKTITVTNTKKGDTPITPDVPVTPVNTGTTGQSVVPYIATSLIGIALAIIYLKFKDRL